MTTNAEQAAHWNDESESGHWITNQERYDTMLAPFADLVFDAGALQPGDRVLDVGCGCGATTLAAAKLVMPGSATGIDLSRPMLARAEQGATRDGVSNIGFIQGEAQVHPFAKGSYDRRHLEVRTHVLLGPRRCLYEPA